MKSLRPGISVIILSSKDDQSLHRAIASAAWAEETLIISDKSKPTPSYSVPKSVRVLSHDLLDDFAQQRNWSLTQVTTEWSLFLDSDEWLSSELIEELQRIVLDPTAFQAYFIPRRDFFLGRLLKHGETGGMKLLRLAKTSLGQGLWERPVHEVWNVSGPTGVTQEKILHQPATDLASFLQKLQRYSQIEAGIRQPLSQTKVVLMLLSYPIAKFLKGYVWQQGWRDGFPGLSHAFCMAVFSLMVRVQCWEAWYGQS